MILDNEIVEEKVKSLNGWKRADEKTIERVYTFSDFLNGIHFVNKIAEHAETVNHHPHLTINHTEITVRLTTVDAGGITEKDIRSAFEYNRLISTVHA
ncbi:4a-hydroxytetrahydrobiopterin dehydratase [Thalassorhabdus alkalitolerans]|uniref:4a-hydroxytetrahydrobiopterin dehydratase n=1 Tax=Thalassorhabdus alkalitolerans TaxID=2282697 RepID=A0ABW0YQD5_9BACI|nr:4a-hydroxytetrahydrobiopterin dehydratase [Thalassobacillus sp. C254]